MPHTFNKSDLLVAYTSGTIDSHRGTGTFESMYERLLETLEIDQIDRVVEAEQDDKHERDEDFDMADSLAFIS